MHKLLCILSVIILPLVSANSVPAQTKTGLGLTFGTYLNRPGLQWNIYYQLHSFKNIELGGDITISFPKINRYSFVGQPYRDKTLLYALNTNIHYFLTRKSPIVAYAIGGLNMSLIQFRNLSPYGAAHETKLKDGVNAGIGMETKLSFLTIFFEGKYVFSEIDQLVVGFGIRLPLK